MRYLSRVIFSRYREFASLFGETDLPRPGAGLFRPRAGSNGCACRHEGCERCNMGFVGDFILMNELRATKIAFANLPPYSQQIALREFRQLTSKSESCDSKETLSARVFEAALRRQELGHTANAIPEWVGACLAESHLLMRQKAWSSNSKWQSKLAEVEAWIEQATSGVPKTDG